MTNKCACGKSAHEDDALFCSKCGAELAKPQFGRAAIGKTYYYVDEFFNVMSCEERGKPHDHARFESGNYYPVRDNAYQAAKKQKLDALAKRWRAEHDPVELDWENPHQPKWYYFFSDNFACYDKLFMVRAPFALYFSSKEKTQQFINEYRDLILDVLGVK